jgi:hypothetical protein
LLSGLPLLQFNFVLHRWSPRRHETTFSNSNLSPVSARSVPLRLAVEQISDFRFLNISLRLTFSP